MTNNYRGTANVEFIWNGTQSDPELRYNGRFFNYWDIEDALYDMFTEENPDLDVSGEWADDAVLADAMFDKFVQERCADYMEDCIYGGYFWREDELIEEIIAVLNEHELIAYDGEEEDLRRDLREWRKRELEHELNRLKKKVGIF